MLYQMVIALSGHNPGNNITASAIQYKTQIKYYVEYNVASVILGNEQTYQC